MKFKANSDDGYWILNTDLTNRLYRKHMAKLNQIGIAPLSPSDQIPKEKTFSISKDQILKNIGEK